MQGDNTSVMRLAKVLVVDDEEQLRTALLERLPGQGYEAVAFASGAEALETLKEQDFDILLTDLMMPEMDGVALLKASLEIDPNLVGIIMTGHATVQTAVDAMKVGAFDYVMKPFKMQALLPVLARAMDVRRLRLENMQLRQIVAIYELGQAMSYTLTLNTIPGKVADAALQQLEADESSVMLLTKEGRELYVAAVRGENRQALLGQRLPLAEGIAGWVARHHEPLVLHGEVDDPRFAPLRPRPDIQSAISHPLLARGRLVGVLNVNSVQRRRAFTLGEIKGLSILATIAAAALEGARLYAELQEAEAKYRSIVDNEQIGIALLSPKMEILELNRQMREWFPKINVEERPICYEAYNDPPREAPCSYCPTIKTLQDGLVHEAETETPAGDEVRNYRLISSPVWDEAGKVTGAIKLVEDVTERKRAEEELRQSEERFRTIFDSATDGILLADIESKGFFSANQTICRMLGYSQEELQNMGVMDIHPQEELTYVISQVEKQVRQDSALATDIPMKRKDGSLFYADVNSAPVTIGGRKYLMGIFRDITERKLAEEALRNALTEAEERHAEVQSLLEQLRAAQQQLVQQERLSALGQMASGIAHDFNNALSPIVGFSSLMMMRPEVFRDPDKVKRYVELIATGGTDAMNVVKRLQEFYRKREEGEEFVPVDVHSLVAQVISLTQPKWRDQALARGITIDIRTELQKVPRVLGNEAELREALTNLVFNAVDAIVQKAKAAKEKAESGTITMRTFEGVGVWESGRGEGRSTPPYPPTPTHVVLEVSDTGVGMTEEVRQRCLEPFFSTKGEAGTGMGLSMVYGIVARHQGTMDIRSEPGKGTTLVLRLPLPAEYRTAPPSAQSVRPSRKLSILVVDDDPRVREAVLVLLTEDGHIVETATNGSDGLEKFRAGSYDVVVTDRAMPEMTGDRLAQAVKQIAPDRPVILMTGFGDLMRATVEKVPGVDLVLSKPVTLGALRQAIAQVAPEEG